MLQEDASENAQAQVRDNRAPARFQARILEHVCQDLTLIIGSYPVRLVVWSL
jgi:hypothetical protein